MLQCGDLLLPGSLPAAHNGLCHVASVPRQLLGDSARHRRPSFPLASEQSSAPASYMYSKYRHGCAVAVSVLMVWGRGGTLIMSLSSSPGLFCPLGTPPTSHARSAASQTSSLKLTLYSNLPAHRAPHPAKLNLATMVLTPSKIST